MRRARGRLSNLLVPAGQTSNVATFSASGLVGSSTTYGAVSPTGYSINSATGQISLSAAEAGSSIDVFPFAITNRGHRFGKKFTLTIGLILSLTGAGAYRVNDPVDTVIWSIVGVKAGETPTLTPNDGRVKIGGSELTGWKVLKGASASSVGEFDVTVSSPSSASVTQKVTVQAAVDPVTDRTRNYGANLTLISAVLNNDHRVWTNLGRYSGWYSNATGSQNQLIEPAYTDAEGRLRKMAPPAGGAGNCYKLCPRPSAATGYVKLKLVWTGSANFNQVVTFATGAGVQNVVINNTTKTVTFEFRGPADPNDYNGFQLHWTYTSADDPVMSWDVREVDAGGNYITTEDFYPPFVDFLKRVGGFRLLDASNINWSGPSTFITNATFETLPADPMYPLHSVRDASMTISNGPNSSLVISAAQYNMWRTGFEFSCRMLTRMNASATDWASFRTATGDYGNNIFVKINPPSGAGALPIESGNLVDGLYLTFSPPSTVTTAEQLRVWLLANTMAMGQFDGALHVATASGSDGTGAAPHTNGNFVQLTGGTPCLEPDGMSVQQAVRLANKARVALRYPIRIGCDDDLVREKFEYIRDNLDPDLEFSTSVMNEIWNGALFTLGYALPCGMLVSLHEKFGGASPQAPDRNIISSITNSGNVATVVTSTPHGHTQGDSTTVKNASLAANNGTFVLDYISPTSFSYRMASSPGANPTGARLGAMWSDRVYYAYAWRYKQIMAIAKDVFSATPSRLRRIGEGLQVGGYGAKAALLYETLGLAACTDEVCQAPYDDYRFKANANKGQYAPNTWYKKWELLTDWVTKKVYWTTANGQAGASLAADIASGLISELTATNTAEIMKSAQDTGINAMVGLDAGLSLLTNDRGEALITGTYEAGYAQTVCYPNRETFIKRVDTVGGSTTATVYTHGDHGFANGDTANILSLNGYATIPSGAYAIFGVAPGKFNITLATADSGTNGTVYEREAELSGVSISNSGTTATVTLPINCRFAVGQSVLIAGASLSANNGTVTVTGVSGKTFTYTMASAPGSSPTGTIQITDASARAFTKDGLYNWLTGPDMAKVYSYSFSEYRRRIPRSGRYFVFSDMSSFLPNDYNITYGNWGVQDRLGVADTGRLIAQDYATQGKYYMYTLVAGATATATGDAMVSVAQTAVAAAVQNATSTTLEFRRSGTNALLGTGTYTPTTIGEQYYIRQTCVGQIAGDVLVIDSAVITAVPHVITMVFLAGTSSFVVPSDFNPALPYSIECFGCGGTAGNASAPPNNFFHGGGGGAYALEDRDAVLGFTVGATVNLSIGAGGAGAATWCKSSTTVKADYGRNAGAATGQQAAGGLAASSIGRVTFSGGAGGVSGGSDAAQGGGGCAGSHGAGGSVTNTSVPTGGGGADGGGVANSGSGLGGSNRLGVAGTATTDKVAGTAAPGGGGGPGAYFAVVTGKIECQNGNDGSYEAQYRDTASGLSYGPSGGGGGSTSASGAETGMRGGHGNGGNGRGWGGGAGARRVGAGGTPGAGAVVFRYQVP